MAERRTKKEIKLNPPGPYTVSCVGYGGAERDHLWKAMMLSYDKDGRPKTKQISGWMSREELREKFPQARDSGSSGLCPTCEKKYEAALKRAVKELDAQKG